MLIGVSLGLGLRMVVLFFQPNTVYKTNFFDLWFDWGQLVFWSLVNFLIVFRDLGLIKLEWV